MQGLACGRQRATGLSRHPCSGGAGARKGLLALSTLTCFSSRPTSSDQYADLSTSTSASRHTSESSGSRPPTATSHEREDASYTAHAQPQGYSCSSTPSRGSARHSGAASVSSATVSLVVAALTCLTLLTPPLGHCSEAWTGSSLNALQSFLSYVESLGAAGPWVFVLTVMLFEMVPLFPTQPLSIASGLLFGPFKGTLIVLLGGTLAATNAFLISRGVGRKLAEKVIVMEMSEDHGVVASKLAKVQHAIRSGGFWQQLTAVILLRLTPVVPFSASNYVLGLTPVQMPAYIGGTVIGISVWSLLYASLGGASRQLLDGGMDVSTIFTDLAERAGKYSSIALFITLGLGVAAAAVFAISRIVGQPAGAPEQLASGTDEAVSDSSSAEESPMLQPEAVVRK